MGINNEIDTIFKNLWNDYCTLNPEALRIFNLLSQEGEVVINDHIALRTFNHPILGISSLSWIFEEQGYQKKNDYIFKEKKLKAMHFEHNNPLLPKVFISELELENFSPALQQSIDSLVQRIPKKALEQNSFCHSGRLWDMSHKMYQDLYKESEYAAWVSAFGFRANHFTVSINHLKKFHNITDLNSFIKKNGYDLNKSGGEIKGTPEELLEQSSTMAKPIEMSFTDGKFLIPACYYEFAKRYPMKDGKLYQGFIAKSADKIFESTNNAN